MPASTKLIKGRIKSIKSTRKITKAMELVAASKMRKAVSNALATRPFSRHGWDVLTRIVGRGDSNAHPLLQNREVKKILVILVTTNRGLVGGLNANLLNFVERQLRDPSKLMISRVGDTWEQPKNETAEISIATIGKKGEKAMARMNYKIVASFNTVTDTPTFAETRPISKFMIDEFLAGTYDKVVLAYNDFISAVAQKPRLRQILPISSYDLEKMIAHLDRGGAPSLFASGEGRTLEYKDGTDYLFEPSEREVLQSILPKLTATQLFQALLEASASEHSARMVAMKNASDAAKDIIDDLQLSFNQVRQAGITAEIAEISSGAAALK